MAEEKKKVAQQKAPKGNNKKVTNNRRNQNNKNRNTSKKATQNRKQPTKKVQTKKVEKVEVKKVEPKKIEKDIKEEVTEAIETILEQTEEIQVIQEDEQLEKTLIFDGRESQNLAEVVSKLEEENVVLEDKVIKRNKINQIIIMVLCALIALTIVITAIYVIKEETSKPKEIKYTETVNSNVYEKVSSTYDSKEDIDTSKKNDKIDDKEDYKYIESITLGEFEKKILEQEDMIVLVASTTCYASINFEPTVNKVGKKEKMTFYRINITSLTDKEINRFRNLYAFTSTPTLFEVKDGVVTKDTVGSLTEEDLITWLNTK